MRRETNTTDILENKKPRFVGNFVELSTRLNAAQRQCFSVNNCVLLQISTKKKNVHDEWAINDKWEITFDQIFPTLLNHRYLCFTRVEVIFV